MAYLFNRKIQLAILIVLLAAVIVSFLYGSANMLQNLVAEAAGIALGVWLTVTLVERLLERQRRDRWKEVRGQVFRAISTHVIYIALEYMTAILRTDWVHYLESVTEGFGEPTLEAAYAMSKVLETMRKQPDVVKVQELFRKTEWHFASLRDSLTLRIIEFGVEPEVIRLLTEVDAQHAAWKKWLACAEELPLQVELETEQEEKVVLELGKEQRRTDLHLAFMAAMDTLEALIALYRYLATSQTTNPI